MQKENLGDQIEDELFDLLRTRFGGDCVYHSPKYRKINGQEKELSDVLIVSLPYVISFQSKWLSYSSDDFDSEKGKIIASRVVKRMEEGARQHKSLKSLLLNSSSLELPLVWDEDGGTYQLPTALIKRIIPIVVMDFDDKRYDDPDSRLILPPIVVNDTNRQSDISVVHAFMFKDLVRILCDMFTVGDLIAYLNQRSRILERQNRFPLHFNELTLFAVYLTKFDLFEKILQSDFVLFLENDIYEHRMTEINKAIQQRRELYSVRDRVDDIMLFLADNAKLERSTNVSLEAVATRYVTCLSRLKCFGSMFKRMISDAIEYCWTRVVVNNEQSHFSYIINAETNISGQAIIVACFDVESREFVENSVRIQEWSLRRLMTAIKGEQTRSDIVEVLMIIFNRNKEKIMMRVHQLEAEDYDLTLSESEAMNQRKIMTRGNYHLEEWSFLKSNK